MTDRISKLLRSKNMSAVKSRGNKTTELALIKLLRKSGISGWRRNVAISGIRPDFIFIKRKIVIFVHGCFWHGCSIHRPLPKTHTYFWKTKIRSNIKRDRRQILILSKARWIIIKIWEHEIKNNPDKVIAKIRSFLK